MLVVNTNQVDALQYDTTFKAYMDYRTITDKSSEQWAIQQQAYTDENGFRKIDDMYCIAVGTYYAENCGTKLIIQLDDDTEFNAIVADLKQDIHTDETHRFTLLEKNGESILSEHGVPMVNVIEFIVDTEQTPEEVKLSGSISSVNFEGNIKTISEVL